MSNNVYRLTAIGFRKVGRIVLSSSRTEELSICVLNLDAAERVLYAFVTGEDVQYVGYTDRQLKRRMTAYENRGRDGTTDRRIDDNLMALLKAEKEIDLYAMANDHMGFHGEFQIDLTAALEKSIIHQLKPPWNKSGTRKQWVLNTSIRPKG